MRWLLVLWLWLLSAAPVAAGVVTSDDISDVAVTIYRDPDRISGVMDAGWPGGYALITETRTITLPAGESLIRFENVAEGLLPETAIITGLPKGVREKNRDARLISPAGLVDAFLKRRVLIRRTDKATGKVREESAIIQSGPNGGVLIQTAAGVEALKCSGLPERMIYPGVPDTLTARPTLSVLTRADKPVTAKIQLTYMAQGFDWSANYVANMAPNEDKLGLFAWLTVANGGQQSFPNARMQVIAGKLNKRENNPPPPPPASGLNLQCWPLDNTSTHPVTPWYQIPLPPLPQLVMNDQVGRNPPGSYVKPSKKRKLRKGRERAEEIMVTGQRISKRMQDAPMAVSVVSSDELMPAPPPPPPSPPPPAPEPALSVEVAEGSQAQVENLGDLKLFRVPMRVNVAAQSQKQVAMITQPNTQFERLFSVNIAGGNTSPQAMPFLLRSRNVKEKGLGVALPAGSVALFEPVANRPMLVSETPIEDLAVGQDVNWHAGYSSDVQWTVTRIAEQGKKQQWQVGITNAFSKPVKVELIMPYDFENRPEESKRGQGGWIVPVTVPANGEARYDFTLKI